MYIIITAVAIWKEPIILPVHYAFLESSFDRTCPLNFGTRQPERDRRRTHAVGEAVGSNRGVLA